MVFWKKNLFCLPSNKVGKQFINELTSLIDMWLSDGPSKEISLKSLMLLPNLMLQKTSQKSSNETKLILKGLNCGRTET